MDLKQISVTEIIPPIVQPRLPVQVASTDEDAEWLQGLAFSLRERGQRQAVTVAWDEAAGKYRIIHGERRWRAAQEAGQEMLTCVVQSTYPPLIEFLADTVAENESRQGLKDMELAWAMYVSYYILNLQALGRKYDQTAPHLQEVDQQVLQIANGIDYLDAYDTFANRQQAVREFLEGELETTLLDLGIHPPSWRPLVSWRTCLEKLGLSYLSKRDRLRYLELLEIAPAVQADVAASEMSAAAKRALANHPPEIQEKIVRDAQEEEEGLDGLTAAEVQERATAYQRGNGDEDDEDIAPFPLPLRSPEEMELLDSKNGNGLGDDVEDLDDNDPFHMHQTIKQLGAIETQATAHAAWWTDAGREMVLAQLLQIAREVGGLPIDERNVGLFAMVLPQLAKFVDTHAPQIEIQMTEGGDVSELFLLTSLAEV